MIYDIMSHPDNLIKVTSGIASLPMELKDKKPWRDFAHTVEVITGSALAEHERHTSKVAATETVPSATRTGRAGGGKPRHYVTLFELERLAAASAEELSVRKGELYTRDGNIVGKFAPNDGHLRLSLQLKGYALLSTYGGRMARLTCFNGVQSDSFRFDERGSAELELPDDAATQEGLGRVTLDFSED